MRGPRPSSSALTTPEPGWPRAEVLHQTANGSESRHNEIMGYISVLRQHRVTLRRSIILNDRNGLAADHWSKETQGHKEKFGNLCWSHQCRHAPVLISPPQADSPAHASRSGGQSTPLCRNAYRDRPCRHRKLHVQCAWADECRLF